MQGGRSLPPQGKAACCLPSPEGFDLNCGHHHIPFLITSTNGCPMPVKYIKLIEEDISYAACQSEAGRLFLPEVRCMLPQSY